MIWSVVLLGPFVLLAVLSLLGVSRQWRGAFALIVGLAFLTVAAFGIRRYIRYGE